MIDPSIHRFRVPSGCFCYALAMPNSIVHFEIPADDVGRAKKFYEKAFGWKISDPWKMNYFLVETKAQGEDGINGGLMTRKEPGQSFMNYIAVPSIDASCKKVEAAGGVVVMPRTEIGQGMGWIAAFKDTEGNIMGFHESPSQPPAKKAVKAKPVVKSKKAVKKVAAKKVAAKKVAAKKKR
jgi:predicted enzyme related to lactoylglutathione lyase